ncbi:hypothetical protein C8F04DRAFT_1098406 [Mycena alexandri]|uniref:Uncharacterized protein n=1 Tax=Mycena alexandri TaxID=1745969 RepID=A0AAD6X1I0_9AGAR|nr:hypothetical protein C8F04DRAFT_1098406 [Mycena alexandri]
MAAAAAWAAAVEDARVTLIGASVRVFLGGEPELPSGRRALEDAPWVKGLTNPRLAWRARSKSCCSCSVARRRGPGGRFSLSATTRSSSARTWGSGRTFSSKKPSRFSSSRVVPTWAMLRAVISRGDRTVSGASAGEAASRMRRAIACSRPASFSSSWG